MVAFQSSYIYRGWSVWWHSRVWNAIILFNPRYLRTLECHYIVWPTISAYSGMPPYCSTHDIYVLWNATTGTTTSNMNVIRYGVIPEFIYIVGRPYGGIPEFVYIVGRTIWWHSRVRRYRGSYNMVAFQSTYISWILYDPRYLRTLECHYIVWPTISAYSGMPPYCSTHDIYVLWNATILYEPWYFSTLEWHHIVRPTILRILKCHHIVVLYNLF
jgi:hypothetical protein